MAFSPGNGGPVVSIRAPIFGDPPTTLEKQAIPLEGFLVDQLCCTPISREVAVNSATRRRRQHERGTGRTNQACQEAR